MGTRTAFVALVTVALVVAILGVPVLAAATSASVTVTFVVAPSVTAEVVDDGLRVLSNAPWTLVAETAEGSVTVQGDATGGAGRLVELPGLTGYTLVLESSR